ncbi:expressed unknown protein [Seminavis robusta]|uniref:Uncharacterized protein n=1 Tax=Seminavis robusta TaxID=568900 RepID=A0A9N8H7X1_9STRA|nr:expressed unknown protein [Seminavis robusta]|eukprot:Sro142_g066070.1 n/a (301) ;mRNA; r:17016-17918
MSHPRNLHRLVPAFSFLLVSSAIEFQKTDRRRSATNCDTAVKDDAMSKRRGIQRLHGVALPKYGGGIIMDRENNQRVTLGRVEAWKDVTWKDYNSNRYGKGYIQLSFRSHDSVITKEAHWIQYIKRQKWDKEGNTVDQDENIPVDRSLWHRRGEWFLDVPRRACSPFYDEWSMHHRTETQVSIFDQPLGSLDPRLHSKLLIELESHLVLQGKIVWRIRWQVVETAQHGRQVEFLAGGPVDSLADELKPIKRWKIGYSHCHRADEGFTVYLQNEQFSSKAPCPSRSSKFEAANKELPRGLE